MLNTDKSTFPYQCLLWLYAVFYIIAGLNHFISTEVYYVIMPKWLPVPEFLIFFSGILEIISGILLLFLKTRKYAAWLIIMFLIAFLPAHFYMIQIAPFTLGKIYVSPILAWLRLPLQLVFIMWAWYYTKAPAHSSL